MHKQEYKTKTRYSLHLRHENCKDITTKSDTNQILSLIESQQCGDGNLMIIMLLLFAIITDSLSIPV